MLVVLLFIAPLYQMLLRQDIIIQQRVHYSVEKLTDTVRECGYLTKNMYLDFEQELLATGIDYDIKTIHYQKVYFEGSEGFQPDYSLYLDEDIMPELETSKIYYLSKGDLFAVEIKSMGGTLGMNMSNMITGKQASPIYVRVGGLVLNENH